MLLQTLNQQVQKLKQNIRSPHKMKGDSPTITSVITGGRRRLMYVFQDGREMIEEFDIKTHELLFRKIKKPATFKQAKWEVEVGDESTQKVDPDIIVKASNTPIFIRKDTLDSFQWRVRNLPYPEDAYILEVDPQKQEVVIKTTVKKYYKRFSIPDLLRVNIKLNKDCLSFQYKNSTLVVSYKKPQIILGKEVQMRKQFQKMNSKKPKEGDIECTTQ